MDSTTQHVLLVVFFATMVCSTFGFGEALVAVPLLALTIPIEIAACRRYSVDHDSRHRRCTGLAEDPRQQYRLAASLASIDVSWYSIGHCAID
jgi:hypothetical protein